MKSVMERLVVDNVLASLLNGMLKLRASSDFERES